MSSGIPLPGALVEVELEAISDHPSPIHPNLVHQRLIERTQRASRSSRGSTNNMGAPPPDSVAQQSDAPVINNNIDNNYDMKKEHLPNRVDSDTETEIETEVILNPTDGHGLDQKIIQVQHHLTISDEPVEIQKKMALPPCFTGAKDLKVPHLLQGHVSSVTLPSRLKLLGRRGYKLMAALSPINCGNAVVGFAPVCSSTHWSTKRELFLLPWVLSKANARMHMFVRIELLLLSALFIVSISGAADVHVGRIWPIGVVLAIVVMYMLTLYRRAPDGTMAFCRSMGTPEVEEYMFSYSWKVQPDNIRTLAKAMWEGGVGVWIDVVKLCPGDEIRPMVRTMVNRVYRVVVFLSPAYISSPNCCVEFMEAAQHPEKLVVCVLKDCDPAVYDYLDTLKAKGAKICFGMHQIIKIMDEETTAQDYKAFTWWRKQQVSGAGVPSHVVPNKWNIDRFSLRGRPFIPPKSVDVGPMYLSGTCMTYGRSIKLPWLFIMALIGVACNFIDLYLKFKDEHTIIDYVWLIAVACCNLAPFWNFANLLDTRRDLHYALRPLMASKAISPGVKVAIVGSNKDPITASLRGFLSSIGHLAEDQSRLTIRDSIQHGLAKRNKHVKNGSGGNGDVMNGGPPDAKLEIKNVTDEGFGDEVRVITVYVMDTIEARDQLFGAQRLEFDTQTSLFIWSGKDDPFSTKDHVSERLMRFLVLVAAWEKSNLAESLFSAIGVRVVELLHRH